MLLKDRKNHKLNENGMHNLKKGRENHIFFDQQWVNYKTKNTNKILTEMITSLHEHAETLTIALRRPETSVA
jgi:hypothetical protein